MKRRHRNSHESSVGGDATGNPPSHLTTAGPSAGHEKWIVWSNGIVHNRLTEPMFPAYISQNAHLKCLADAGAHLPNVRITR
jgi:hypothetical protein